MVKNKRGWLRLVEAMIAIILVLGVVLTVSTRKNATMQDDLTEMIRPIVDEIANNPTMRGYVLSGDPSDFISINKSVGEKIPAAYGYMVKICPPSDVCGLEAVPSGVSGDIYTVERIITATSTRYNPKKIKIFAWRKG